MDSQYTNGNNHATTATIIAELLQGWKLPIVGCHEYCDENGLQYPSESVLSLRVNEACYFITAEYDALAHRLGRAFAYGDQIFKQDAERIENEYLEKLTRAIGKQVMINLSDSPHYSNGDYAFPPPQPPRPSSGASTPAIAEPRDWEKLTEKYVQSAQDKTIQALQDLASRLGHNENHQSPSMSASNRPLPSSTEANFCAGALLLQQSKADLVNVLQQRTSAHHYVCTHCYLEISAFESPSLTYTADDWAAIAACHVLAYPSLKDRRAAYRCYACAAWNHTDHLWPDAAAIRAHIDGCERMKALKATRSPSVQVPLRQRQARDTGGMPSSPYAETHSYPQQQMRQPQAEPFLRSQPRTPNDVSPSRSPQPGTAAGPPLLPNQTGTSPIPPPRPPRYDTEPAAGFAPPQMTPQYGYQPHPTLSVPGSFPETNTNTSNPRASSQPGDGRREGTPTRRPTNSSRAQTPNPPSNPPPPPPPQAPAYASQQDVSDETAIELVIGAVGRTRGEALDLLRRADGDVEAAIDRGLRENDEGLAPPKPARAERQRKPY